MEYVSEPITYGLEYWKGNNRFAIKLCREMNAVPRFLRIGADRITKLNTGEIVRSRQRTKSLQCWDNVVMINVPAFKALNHGEWPYGKADTIKTIIRYHKEVLGNV